MRKKKKKLDIFQYCVKWSIVGICCSVVVYPFFAGLEIEEAVRGALILTFLSLPFEFIAYYHLDDLLWRRNVDTKFFFRIKNKPILKRLLFQYDSHRGMWYGVVIAQFLMFVYAFVFGLATVLCFVDVTYGIMGFQEQWWERFYFSCVLIICIFEITRNITAHIVRCHLVKLGDDSLRYFHKFTKKKNVNIGKDTDTHR